MPHFQKVLCPTDLSEPSSAALRYAIAMARRFGGRVHALHTWAMPVVPTAETAFTVSADTLDRIGEDLERALAATVAAHQAPAVPIESRVVMGAPATTIVREAIALGCDSIILGTHGRTGLRHALIGSVAEHVLRHSPVPVLVVPLARDTADEPAKRQMRTLLCPVDFSTASEAALAHAIELATALTAIVHVVHCFELSTYASPSSQLAKSHEVDIRRDLAALLLRHPTDVEIVQHVVHGPTAAQVVALGDSLGCDLVVMGTTGKTGFAHFMLGSVTERVVRTSHVPVLTIRPATAPR